MTKQIPVILDIDEIPEDLYDRLLAEFQIQHGAKGRYIEWRITAIKEIDNE